MSRCRIALFFIRVKLDKQVVNALHDLINLLSRLPLETTLLWLAFHAISYTNLFWLNFLSCLSYFVCRWLALIDCVLLLLLGVSGLMVAIAVV